MTKPPNKGGTTEDTAPPKSLGNIPYQTRATTLAAAGSKAPAQQGQAKAASSNTKQSSKDKDDAAGKTAPVGSTSPPETQSNNPLRVIEEALSHILDKEKIVNSTRTLIEGVISFIHETEAVKRKKAKEVEVQAEVSTLRKLLKHDLSKMYDAITKQLDGILDTTSATLINTEKVQTETSQLSVVAKEIQSKIGKVNDVTDKIASTTQTYRDVLASNCYATSV